jgi:hypothetical protein
MVWGFISPFMEGLVLCEIGALDAKGYKKLLRTHLIPRLEDIRSDEPDAEFVFMQDNAPPHTAKVCLCPQIA